MGIWYAVVSIVAILAGPILAIQLQKFLERRTDKRQRQMGIFKTLMATRASALSPEHVQALNMIELEFQDQRTILAAWHEYLDHLGENLTDEAVEAWVVRKHDLQANLLDVMGKHLGFDFDKVVIKKGAYLPTAHSNWEMTSHIIREHLVKVLTGQKPLNVAFAAADPDSKTRNEATQAAIARIISGEQPINVRLVGPEEITALAKSLGGMRVGLLGATVPEDDSGS